MIKWGASSRWSFGPNSAWCSIETTTIGKTQPTLESEENDRKWKIKTITVLLRRMSGDNLNIPMFFGFVGMFIMLMFWPGLGK